MNAQLYEEVRKAIRNTRELSLPQYGSAQVQRHKGANITDIVTEVDIQIESALQTALRALDPDIGFVGEESGGDANAERFWLVDPIDGTQLYVRGLPGCTTMVSLIENGEVVLGMIYDFVTDTLYHAAKGSGAFSNDAPMAVSDRPLANAYIGYEINTEKPEHHALYFKLMQLCGPVKYISSGYEYALVASGKLDARICYDPFGYIHDFAPGSLLVLEAGGVVTNIGSDRYDYRVRDHIAANPQVHRELTEGANALFPVHS